MAKRQKTKTELLGIRITPKTRYGLELLSRKNRQNLSEIVGMAIQSYLDENGITAKQDGQHFSLLDTLWSESAARRLHTVVAYHGGNVNGHRIDANALLSDEDRTTGFAIGEIVDELLKEATGEKPLTVLWPDLWETLDGHLDEIRSVATTPAGDMDEWRANIKRLAESLGLTRNS